MIITINHGVTGVDLTATVRNLDAARTVSTADIQGAETNAPGEYLIDVTEPAGDYHLAVLADGVLVLVGYLQITSATTYSIVGGYDDLGREPTATEIEHELGDGSDVATPDLKVLV